jgi:DNA polymerase-4
MEAPLPFIVHIDADAFFVGCEQARRPELRGKKCAVGGTERGIISSASYEARACGVYTPMPSSQAMRVCPDLILIPHTSGLYGKVSEAMFDRCESITPWVQRNSIDEGYLDLAPCGLKSSAEVEGLVRGLQQRIWDELKITVSMGIAANKLVAQIASKLRKPQGFVVVPVGTERDFLAPLSIGKLPGIGAKTEATLAEFGFKCIGDVFGRSERELKAAFGSDWAAVVAMARGEDDRRVETITPEAKSYSQQETFTEDVGEFSKIERVAKGMIDELLAKVRADGKRVRTITVRVRYGDFTQTSQGKSLVEASDLEAPFYPLLGSLLREAWNQRRKLRLVSVRFSGVEESGAQLEMFAQGDEKRRKLAAVLDRLNLGGKSAGVSRGHQLGGTKRD